MLPRVVTWRCCSGPAHTAAPGTSGPAPMPPLVVTWTCCSGPAQRAAPGTSGPAPMPPMVVTLRCCSGHVRRAARGTLKSASTGHPPATLRRGRGFRSRYRQMRVEPQIRDMRDRLCVSSAPERLPDPVSRSHGACSHLSPEGAEWDRGAGFVCRAAASCQLLLAVVDIPRSGDAGFFHRALGKVLEGARVPELSLPAPQLGVAGAPLGPSGRWLGPAAGMADDHWAPAEEAAVELGRAAREGDAAGPPPALSEAPAAQSTSPAVDGEVSGNVRARAGSG
mmetsp:Transcript_19440/g.57363  ORF Transcript_19440/g.57363 Transcript_19440/m.57363 type:complete len:280 (+) Transcript_19440:1-840(+)